MAKGDRGGEDAAEGGTRRWEGSLRRQERWVQCQGRLDRATQNWVGEASAHSWASLPSEFAAALGWAGREGQWVVCPVLLALSFSFHLHPSPVPIPVGIQPL